MTTQNSISKKSKIYISGHNGLVGSALVRRLKNTGYDNLIYATRTELDLLDRSKVDAFLNKNKPDYIFLAAAKVGGIYANNFFRADFIYENLQIQNNIIHSAFKHNINKLCFLGSSCIYPRICPQPIKESFLLTGELEKTNEPYAIAKIAGIKLCESLNEQYKTEYLSVMPTNLYGPNDNYDMQNGHVLPSLLRRFHEAKVNKVDQIIVWGTGNPMREFLYVDDMADACIFLMENNIFQDIVNIGYGSDISIKDLAELIKKIVGYKGEIKFDLTKPDGTPKKLLDISRLSSLGWMPKVNLEDGIKKTYTDFLQNY